MVQNGIAIRYKLSETGRRQIMSFHLPGDMVDLQTILFRTADHSIEAGRNSTIVMIPHEAMLRMTRDWPTIARALWFDTLVDAAIQREMMLNIGRRDAMARTCHLLCELYIRYGRIGRVIHRQVDLGLTQTELADGLGMTPIHLNRVIARLRRDGCITLDGRLLTVHDFAALQQQAGFDPNYLQLDGPDLLRI
jgi:CRP-like cAMP-binding protein